MAETNAGVLREAGARDAQALTVTGRRRAHTGSIRRAAHTLTRTAKAVTPETPNGAWLRDNRTLARAAANDAAAALRHAHTLRASGAQTVLHVCCAGLLRACGNALTPKAAQAYLAGFQDALPLETAELALLVPGLQAATVCALADTYAHDGAAAPALFTSLRALGTAAWAALTERCDRVGRILARDPAGIYPAMDAATRTRYRQTVAQLARRTGRSEIDIAEDVLARAQSGEGARRHVGWFLLREVLGAPEKRRDGAWYIAAVVMGTLALSLLLGFATGSVSGAVLLLIPVSEAVKGLLDAVLLRVTKPRFVPRLALRRGIPPEGKTLCVIATLLTCPDDAHALGARLEEYYLCNRDAGEQLLFGLLADLPEADMEHAPIDHAILRAARTEIEALNARYGGRFYLFTRERTRTPDGNWCAWERKRGALLELARLVLDRPGALHCVAGDAAALRGTAYLLTLDADTRLTPGAARALVGAMLHPLNRPVVDAQRGVVTHGYGLLHPRMATELQSARASDWARVFAGPGGSDPYGGVCGELYMDCFDRGGFSGKGILDVRALLACCGGDALPEQRILSHDALEGAYLHGGFLGDVELTDTFPTAPLAWGARAHRWIRGDWQNAPWIFSRRARALHPIDRFRLADSLRRSLVAPATWAAIFLGCVLRWPGLRLAAYAALLALAQGLIFALGHPIVHPADARVRYHSSVLPGLAAAVVQTVLRLILLPWEALLNASAIVTALWRMTVSHRDLLQWQTAAQRAAKRDGLGAYLRALWPASALGLLTAVLTPSPTGLAAGIVWMLSPFVLAALGAPNAPGAAPLQHAAQRELLGWAKATWHYFETFCTAGEHYLPPDNVQTQPPTGTAHRTSPTNMGFALLSALGAHALGIDNGRGLALAERMLTTMEQLPRWNGHFYNWYHTCTLRPMPPLYVSTVDSGNCAAALLAAANALRSWGQSELAARAQALCDGMDFALLYDPQRRLMHIGIDTGSGKRSEGYYDLLESEARLTSYFAVARGDVPREHWRALSRAQVQHERYRGCVSWSGSVFEYLMPELFLPPQRDSLLWESAKFCLRVQRRRVRTGQPWGVSESAYFALDSALSYRYKAHGCAALAMQPDMDRELVLSPYSAFLALAVAPRAAVRDLRRFAARAHEPAVRASAARRTGAAPASGGAKRKAAPLLAAGLHGRGHGRGRRGAALHAALQRHVLPRRDRGRAELCTLARAERLPPGHTQRPCRRAGGVARDRRRVHAAAAGHGRCGAVALYGARGAVFNAPRQRDRRADLYRTRACQRRGACADAFVPRRDRQHGTAHVRGRARAVGGLCQPSGVRAARLSERAAVQCAAAAPARARREAGDMAVRRVRPAGGLLRRRGDPRLAARRVCAGARCSAHAAGHAVARALCARCGRARRRCVRGGTARARSAAGVGGGAAGGAGGAIRHDGRRA